MSSGTAQIPDFDDLLGGMMAALKPHQRPILIAMLERVAAGRYRQWAADPCYGEHRDALLACGEREIQIAERIEALYDDAATVQQEIQAQMPTLAGVEEQLFGGRTVPEQFAVLEAGERSGGKVWAQLANDPPGDPRGPLRSGTARVRLNSPTRRRIACRAPPDRDPVDLF
jgi:hypothetical protein